MPGPGLNRRLILVSQAASTAHDVVHRLAAADDWVGDDRPMSDSGARAKQLLRKVPPLYRMASSFTHPSNSNARLRAVGRTLKYDVMTRGFKRPATARVGDHSRIVAYPGETNSPHAVYRNPPNTEMFVWAKRLRPGDLFVDVGANIGIYTIFALDLGAAVIAVEPTNRADRVREHLALNGYIAEVVQKALSNEPGTVRITEGLDSFNHLVFDGTDGVDVEATTLDALLGDRTAAGVKIDVEGAERLVLEGATRALSEQRIRLLQLEWDAIRAVGTLGQGRAPVADLLRGYGYAIYRSDENGDLHRVEGEVPNVVDVFAAPEGSV